ncbi:hypothetical protein C7M84_003978 [Penaeus vannamei]|uniref:Uncharacterized protein n=1 Tax=Penaeus vannamei TaxID=6689 RepID=A0A3R7MBJ6_PENVA|nr:hypothetical protein C7M84_003978 [Penaeus vannamei]
MMAGSALECEEVRRLQHDVVIEEGEEFSGCGSEQETNTDRASRPLARESPTLLTYPEFHAPGTSSPLYPEKYFTLPAHLATQRISLPQAHSGAMPRFSSAAPAHVVSSQLLFRCNTSHLSLSQRTRGASSLRCRSFIIRPAPAVTHTTQDRSGRPRLRLADVEPQPGAMSYTIRGRISLHRPTPPTPAPTLLPTPAPLCVPNIYELYKGYLDDGALDPKAEALCLTAKISGTRERGRPRETHKDGLTLAPIKKMTPGELLHLSQDRGTSGIMEANVPVG